MAILGLLLAFSFSIALGRHDHRRLMIVDESNAIGDFYTCATLLKDQHRSALQALIRAYTQNEVAALSRFVTESEQVRITRRSQEMQRKRRPARGV
jgi:hypothetical protein